ncbi:MAG: aminotransferase class I/II-fold pyridoxal phosphate-dependent enzyme [Acidimicrobiales bacterium]
MTPCPDPLGVHGGDGARHARALGIGVEEILDLSASLNPLAPDVAPIVRGVLGAVGRYPDPLLATEALAGAIGVDPGHLLLTNGGAEAISLVARRLGGTVHEPEFSLYPRTGGPTWRSNPNNPLGCLAASDATAGVWDEAFWPLATGTWSRGDHQRGSVVVGSLTKLFACPGLRIGYLVADGDLVDHMRHDQPAWSVGGLACEALPVLLDEVDLVAWCRGVAELRAELVASLVERGLRVRDAAAPWVLVDDAAGLRASLLRHAVVVRDCGSFGMAGTVRIAVPRHDQLGYLLGALDSVLSERI